MKKIILFLIIHVLAIATCFAQPDPRDGRHIFNYGTTLSKCLISGVKIVDAIGNEITDFIDPNRSFVVRNVTASGDYVIQLEQFGNNFSQKSQLNTRYVIAGGQDILFLLPFTLYKLNAERLEKRGTFTVGAATTLIKIRPGKKTPDNSGYNIYSEFGNDFNIGVSAGWKFKPYRKTELAYSGMIGFSYTSVKVTPYTTKDFITSESSQSCITISGGLVFEYNSFQVSAFTGLDIMSGEIGRHWIYRKRPWLGVGFGFEIFRAKGEGQGGK